MAIRSERRRTVTVVGRTGNLKELIDELTKGLAPVDVQRSTFLISHDPGSNDPRESSMTTFSISGPGE